jgi:hypothetical protein
LVALPFFRLENLKLIYIFEANYDSQHLGGIHSGCAVSGISWLLLKVILTWKSHVSEHNTVVIFGTLTNIAVFFTALSAMPWVRNTHHKYVDP